MSDTPTGNTPDDLSVDAGEYVLGTLPPEERAQFETRLNQDPALWAEVYAWQDRLQGLSERVPPQAVDPALLPRLLRGLPPQPLSPQAPSGRAANDTWWQGPGVWRWATALATAATVVLAVMLQMPHTGPAPADGARYVAVLQSPDKENGWLVEVSAGDVVRLVPVGKSPPIPADRAVQFWTKPQGAAKPTSLGLVRPGERAVLPVSKLPAVGEQQLFELTLEPAQGSPYDRPSGPILFVGRSVRL